MSVTIIEPQAVLLTPVSHLVDYEAMLELAGRTCYKSEDRITRESAGKFIKGIIKAGHECYDEQTQVLTEHGWKYFSQISKGDFVYTLGANNIIETQAVMATYESDYNGEMIHFTNDCIDLLVTPNHRMYVCQDRFSHWPAQQIYRFVNASEVQGTKKYFQNSGCWTKAIEECFRINGEPDNGIPLNLWASFMGYYLSEGNIHGNKIRISQNEASISFRFIVDNIRAIAELLGKSIYICNGQNDQKQICFSHANLAQYLKQFGKSPQRYVPDNIKNAKKSVIRNFLTAYDAGDGRQAKPLSQIYTTSYKMADDLQELALKAGLAATITKVELNNPKWYDRYIVGILHDRLFPVLRSDQKPEDATKINYSGKIYCAQVPNGTLYVRRNGKAVWCGNSVIEHCSITYKFVCSRACSHQLVRHRIAAYSQESQRYCDYGKVESFQIIMPPSIPNEHLNFFLTQTENAYSAYLTLRNKGVLPEDARYLLPNCSKTEVVATYNLRQWRHVIEERGLNGHAQWEIRKLCLAVLYELNHYLPNVFGDLVVKLEEKKNESA